MLDGKYGTVGHRKTMEISLSFMSHYAICHPAQQILHHMTKSCKGPILAIKNHNAKIVMQNLVHYHKLHKNSKWTMAIDQSHTNTHSIFTTDKFTILLYYTK